MAIDVLQDKIRKQKNPSVICFSLDTGVVPPMLPRTIEGCGKYYTELLEALRGQVPAARFAFGSFCLQEGGLALLQAIQLAWIFAPRFMTKGDINTINPSFASTKMTNA